MSPPLDPLVVSLELAGDVFLALEFSEAGITLPVSALRALPETTTWGQRIPATLCLTADQASDEYPVEVKVSGSSLNCVELAFSTLPPQARLRMRHAAGPVFADTEMPAPSGALFGEQDALDDEVPASRRFAMGSSASLWEVTRSRRREATRPEAARRPPSVAEAPPPTAAADPPARRLPRADVLFLGCLAAVVVALLLVIG